MPLTKQSSSNCQKEGIHGFTVILKKAVAIRYWLGCIATVKQDNLFTVKC